MSPITSRPAPRPQRLVPARHRFVTRAVAALLALGTGVLLSGCGVRWETSDPVDPSLDAAEAVRRDAVDDALALATAAGEATAGAPEPVAAALALVDGTASEQVDALGGKDDSDLPDAAPSSPTPTTTPTAAPATPADVLALLGTTASAARTDALATADPGLARLLASVAASRAQVTDRLAAALGTDAPAVDAEPAAEVPQNPEASPTDASAEPAAPTTTAPDDDTATELGRTTLLALVAAQDQAGYGFEVAAARLSDDSRTLARSAAAAHRTAAGEWAARAGVAGTVDDPRRVTYAIDADISTAEAVRTFCASLVSDLAAVYADAVLETAPGSADRTATVDGLRQSAVASLTWGATATALPGLPADHAGSAETTQPANATAEATPAS